MSDQEFEKKNDAIIRRNNERSHALRTKLKEHRPQLQQKYPGKDLSFLDHSPVSETLMRERQLNPLVTGDEKIAVFGAGGQIGTRLKPLLEKLYGGKVLYCDSRPGGAEATKAAGFEPVDVTDMAAVGDFIRKNNVKVVINLAALLSSVAEQHPELARKINVEAPLNMIMHAQDWGVRKLQIMSSIAAHESSADPYDSDATKAARKHSGDNASPGLTSAPRASYGQAKRAIETLADYYSTQCGLDVQAPRLAGVLNCHLPWPSDGTTEELDKMIVAAAYKKVYGDDLPAGIGKHFENGNYVPQVSGDATFNMIDGDILPKAVIAMLHKDLRKRGATHNIAGYSVSMQDAANILREMDGHFQVTFDAAHYDAGKMERAGIWPRKSQTDSTEALIGSLIDSNGAQNADPARESITRQYDKVVKQLRMQKLNIPMHVAQQEQAQIS